MQLPGQWAFLADATFAANCVPLHNSDSDSSPTFPPDLKEPSHAMVQSTHGRDARFGLFTSGACGICQNRFIRTQHQAGSQHIEPYCGLQFEAAPLLTRLSSPDPLQ